MAREISTGDVDPAVIDLWRWRGMLKIFGVMWAIIGYYIIELVSVIFPHYNIIDNETTQNIMEKREY